MYRVPVFAKKTFIVLVGAPWPLATPCPEFQCCQTLGQRHPTKMNVFFATGSTRGEGVANIDIWGAGAYAYVVAWRMNVFFANTGIDVCGFKLSGPTRFDAAKLSH